MNKEEAIEQIRQEVLALPTEELQNDGQRYGS
jgi:hypothetical protein